MFRFTSLNKITMLHYLLCGLSKRKYPKAEVIVQSSLRYEQCQHSPVSINSRTREFVPKQLGRLIVIFRIARIERQFQMAGNLFTNRQFSGLWYLQNYIWNSVMKESKRRRYNAKLQDKNMFLETG